MSKLIATQEQTRVLNYFASGTTCRMSKVAERLREAMDDQGVDQSTLARAIGVTQGAISLILVGKTRQSKYLPEIAIELGVSYDWLSGRDVDKYADSPVDLLVTSSERTLIERLRSLPFPAFHALTKVANGFMDATLPSEAALAQMFEGLLAGIDPAAPVAEQALLLAQRLPIGLSQLRDVRPDPDQAGAVRQAQEADAVDPATPHPEPTR